MVAEVIAIPYRMGDLGGRRGGGQSTSDTIASHRRASAHRSPARCWRDGLHNTAQPTHQPTAAQHNTRQIRSPAGPTDRSPTHSPTLHCTALRWVTCKASTVADHEPTRPAKKHRERGWVREQTNDAARERASHLGRSFRKKLGMMDDPTRDLID